MTDDSDPLRARLALWRARAATDTYVDRALATPLAPVRHTSEAGDDAGIDCPHCGEPMLVLAATTNHKRVVGCPSCASKEER